MWGKLFLDAPRPTKILIHVLGTRNVVSVCGGPKTLVVFFFGYSKFAVRWGLLQFGAKSRCIWFLWVEAKIFDLAIGRLMLIQVILQALEFQILSIFVSNVFSLFFSFFCWKRTETIPVDHIDSSLSRIKKICLENALEQ